MWRGRANSGEGRKLRRSRRRDSGRPCPTRYASYKRSLQTDRPEIVFNGEKLYWQCHFGQATWCRSVRAPGDHRELGRRSFDVAQDEKDGCRGSGKESTRWSRSFDGRHRRDQSDPGRDWSHFSHDLRLQPVGKRSRIGLFLDHVLDHYTGGSDDGFHDDDDRRKPYSFRAKLLDGIYRNNLFLLATKPALLCFHPDRFLGSVDFK